MKSTLPLFVSVLSVVVLKKQVNWRTWLSLVPIVCGCALFSAGDMTSSAAGASLALLSSTGRSFKAIFNGLILNSATEKLRPIEVLLLEAPTTGLILALIAALLEGPWGTGAQPHESPNVSFNVACGALMFVTQVSYMMIIERTSPLTCQVIMNVKMMMLVVVSMVLLATPPTAASVLGFIAVILGCTLYASIAAASAVKKSDEIA
jgi:drug/metabolite transporter (DMT)-like permease